MYFIKKALHLIDNFCQPNVRENKKNPYNGKPIKVITQHSISKLPLQRSPFQSVQSCQFLPWIRCTGDGLC